MIHVGADPVGRLDRLVEFHHPPLGARTVALVLGSWRLTGGPASARAAVSERKKSTSTEELERGRALAHEVRRPVRERKTNGLCRESSPLISPPSVASKISTAVIPYPAGLLGLDPHTAATYAGAPRIVIDRWPGSWSHF